MPRSRSRPDLRAAETKNVHWLFDSHPRIRRFIDIHSFGGTILHPWGDPPRRRPTRAGRQPELRQLGGEGRGRHEHVVELRRVWRAAARARLDVTRQPLSGGHHLLIVAATVAGHPISSSVERLSRTQQSRCRGPRGSRRIRASRLDWVLPRRRSPFALQSSRLTTS
jgi:hypothetical protein